MSAFLNQLLGLTNSEMSKLKEDIMKIFKHFTFEFNNSYRKADSKLKTKNLKRLLFQIYLDTFYSISDKFKSPGKTGRHFRFIDLWGTEYFKDVKKNSYYSFIINRANDIVNQM